MSSLGGERTWDLPSLRGFTFPSSGIALFVTGNSIQVLDGWEPCLIKFPRSPLALGYTRGHFSALVPPEPEAACGGAGGGVAPEPREQGSRDCFLPLMTRDR